MELFLGEGWKQLGERSQGLIRENLVSREIFHLKQTPPLTHWSSIQIIYK
jgi:hypothetical protein